MEIVPNKCGVPIEPHSHCKVHKLPLVAYVPYKFTGNDHLPMCCYVPIVVWIFFIYFCEEQIDIDTGHVIHGVSLIPFDAKVLTGWCKPVAIRKLKGLSESEREELSQIVLGLRDHYRGVPYEENTMELIKATIDIFDDHIGLFRNEGGEEALKSIFCSELVAMAYQRLKLIPNDPAFNEYTPEDFASSRSLSLLRGHLEEEIYITFLQEEQD